MKGIKKCAILTGADHLCRGLLFFLIPFPALTRDLSLPIVYVVAFMSGSLGTFFDATFWAFVPAVVGKESLESANARIVSSQSAAQVAGPGIGGVLIALITAPFAFAVNGFSYLFSSYQLSKIHVNEIVHKREESDKDTWKEMSLCFKIIFDNPVLRTLLEEALTYNIFYQMVMAVFFIYTAVQLHLSPYVIGFAFSAGGLGAVRGSILAPGLARRIDLVEHWFQLCFSGIQYGLCWSLLRMVELWR